MLDPRVVGWVDEARSPGETRSAAIQRILWDAVGPERPGVKRTDRPPPLWLADEIKRLKVEEGLTRVQASRKAHERWVEIALREQAAET